MFGCNWENRKEKKWNKKKRKEKKLFLNVCLEIKQEKNYFPFRLVKGKKMERYLPKFERDICKILNKNVNFISKKVQGLIFNCSNYQVFSSIWAKNGGSKSGPRGNLYSFSLLSLFSFLLKQPNEKNCRSPLIFSSLPSFQTQC